MTTSTFETASQRHDRMVREEREQTEAVASRLPQGDFWQSYAGRFRPREGGPADTSDLDALLALVRPEDRVIDVGAGGGRLALPIAARCREVVAVEPSPAMQRVLSDEIARRGAANVRVVPLTWEEAEVEPGELVFTAHVTYGVHDIARFLKKMDAAAARDAVAIVFEHPPQFVFAPFWRAVYGEERLALPCAEELIGALRELGAEPEVSELPPLLPQPLGPRDAAIDELRRRLFAAPGSEADRRLQKALPQLVEERGGELVPRYAAPRRRAFLRWQPGRMA
ncbi:MAG TPA: methyltransferase domain-containing protein [Dehalococcoidia bacterium]|jgi:SAM-dependent methyltransferase|nr:methyltransferase domain-containing protein [Dehalococcoidia bacterium]